MAFFPLERSYYLLTTISADEVVAFENFRSQNASGLNISHFSCIVTKTNDDQYSI